MNMRQFFITQRWWGKFLGGFFGFLCAGPVGGIFGILIGNLFDRGLNEHFGRSHWHFHQEKRADIQEIFFTTTFAIMGHVAKSDGRVSEREIAIAKQIMEELQLSTKQKSLAKKCFTEGKRSDFNLKETLDELVKACHDNRDLMRLFLEIQYQAAAIEQLADQKIHVLNHIFTDLGYAPLYKQYRFYDEFGDSLFRNNQQQQSQQHHFHHRRQSSSHQQHYRQSGTSSLAQAYAILEVSPQHNQQEVKKAYRRLISRNHPDKLIAQGLPESMIKLANNKTQQITKAYDHICQSKGW